MGKDEYKIIRENGTTGTVFIELDDFLKSMYNVTPGKMWQKIAKSKMYAYAIKDLIMRSFILGVINIFFE